ncbi:hypothetical protein KSP40_PGU015728 [Platanthera guangdongensis]|uniref:FRIGIDA-like protein n=1 Tax=Platanthera guangdongensis TaxID=2320717 RepID=A0ABR2LIH5_9ASPA
MADTPSVSTLIDSTASKLQQLQQAFTELENHSPVSLNFKWKELEQHFHGLEQSLKNKFQGLEKEEKDYLDKFLETQKMLERREAAVVEKEQASLERLQEKRDTALSTLFEKYRNYPAALTDGTPTICSPESGVDDGLDFTVVKSDIEDEESAESNYLKGKPHSQLEEFCEKMDVEELHKYISDNRKNLASIREEIPIALRAASNPFSLVLESLKDFYSGEILGSDGKKDAGLLGSRRTCLMLMESLSSLMLNSITLSEGQRLTDKIKEKAKEVANYWKPKLDGLEIYSSSGNSLEAHAFLQLLATFDISSDFDENEICKLIPAVSRRRQTADLCRSLGFLPKIPVSRKLTHQTPVTHVVRRNPSTLSGLLAGSLLLRASTIGSRGFNKGNVNLLLDFDLSRPRKRYDKLKRTIERTDDLDRHSYFYVLPRRDSTYR